MKGITTRTAANMAGVSTRTIQKAIKSGKLSASALDSGGYLIDPSELARVYTIKSAANHSENPHEKVANTCEYSSEQVASLKHELEITRLKLDHANETIKKLNELLEETRETKKLLKMRLPLLRAIWNKL